MIYLELGDSLLLKQFREFYSEVIRLKQIIFVPEKVAILANGEESLAESASSVAWNRLVELLDQQQRVAIQLGGEYWTLYEEARYVMVALADEILLHSDWEGRYAWNFNLLEEKFFQSHIAGDLFFDKVGSLMGQRDPGRIELAKIYLMAMALGFQGRYRGNDNDGMLLTYRRRLYSYIFQTDLLLERKDSELFPDAHKNVLSDSAELRKLPAVRKWALRLLVVMVLSWGVQQVIWRWPLTDDLWRVTREILKPVTE
jgi:type VI secretion system protein ImpK